LALFGLILAEAILIGFQKIPFTSSLLPGNTNVQFVFWRTLAGVVLLSVFVTSSEIPALHNRRLYVALVAAMSVVAAILSICNRRRARSAVLYYEELPDKVITSLKLIAPPVAN
jgi:hypothetical protein